MMMMRRRMMMMTTAVASITFVIPGHCSCRKGSLISHIGETQTRRIKQRLVVANPGLVQPL